MEDKKIIKKIKDHIGRYPQAKIMIGELIYLLKNYGEKNGN